MNLRTAGRDHRTAMVLSGGGARGAYEVGVLSYVFDELTRLRGAPPRIDILSGTSVGAINSCFLAAHLADPVLGLRRLVELWNELELARVLGFGVKQVFAMRRVLSGGGKQGAGVFDVRPMADLVHKEISWRAVAKSLRRRNLRALSVSCTEVAYGRTVVFIQTSPDLVVPADPPPRTLFRAAHIGPQHALASAAIPILFPAVSVDGGLYLDGGLRQNTPIAPALRLGATHIFAVASSRRFSSPLVEQRVRITQSPSATFLLGKVLNAFLLDHVDKDIELLNRLNNVLADGIRAFGDSFVEQLNVEAQRRGGATYRFVRCLALHPSEDIGTMAGDFVKRGQFRGDPVITTRVLKLLDFGSGDQADLASYLLFDGAFCRQLIELGRSDARARRTELLEFFERAPDDGGGLDDLDASGERPSLNIYGS